MGTALDRTAPAAGAATPATATPRSGWLEDHAAPVAVALFAANLLLVLPMIGAQSIWFDEAVTMRNAQQPFDLARYLSADATPPLYPLLVHLWMRVFGATIESARALSAPASAASAALLFQLGRRFLDARSGLIAALLFACSPFQLYFAHEARARTPWSCCSASRRSTSCWRDLLVLLPDAAAAGADRLTAELTARGYRAPSRQDLPRLVPLRFPRADRVAEPTS